MRSQLLPQVSNQRRNIAVILPDGSTSPEKITYQEAFFKVKDSQTARWCARKAIQMLDKRVTPRGFASFSDLWQLKPSGGIPVWQLRTERA